MSTVYEIWRYLASHPEAKDTLEGIQHWWLVQGETRFRKEELRASLEFMVARSWLAPNNIGDTVVYGAKAGGIEQAAEWLARHNR